MIMTQHTQSEWKLVDQRDTQLGETVSFTVVVKHKANVLGADYVWEPVTELSKGTTEEHARLIAAAPKLLEALEKVLFAQQHLLGQFDEEDLAAVDFAKAALAFSRETEGEDK
jgi:hypothetical protein